MNAIDLAKQLEQVYENSYYKYYEYEIKGKKCLALDEQETAILQLCMEELSLVEGYHPENFETKGLFILQKNKDWMNNKCVEERVRGEQLGYKKFNYFSNYNLDGVKSVLIYFAAVLYYANEKNTGDKYQKIKRKYMKVYAYLACLCPRVFDILFQNNIYIFMKRTYKEEDKRFLLEQEKELWDEYITLMTDKERMSVIRSSINTFCEVLKTNNESGLNHIAKLHNLAEDNFLGYDFKEGDTLRGIRFKHVLLGIDYFKCHLSLLEEELKTDSFGEENSLALIEELRNDTEKLSRIFEKLLMEEESKIERECYTKDVDNIYKLIEMFKSKCSCKLIEV